jgi:bacillithiol synthase
MTTTIDPNILYSQAPFFLDFIANMPSAAHLFQHTMSSVHLLADARCRTPNVEARTEVAANLLEYNRLLGASNETLANIAHLRNSRSLCVIGGQQAEFLGGPLFILYKILSIVRTASWLAGRLDVPVVPVFWLASEDHDFSEINHTRWLDGSGSLRTSSFDWDDQGRPIEDLPITDSVQQALREALEGSPFLQSRDAALFLPVERDTYCTWHARIWSRLFSQYGLILVEPRILRRAARPFFDKALAVASDIRSCLEQGEARMTANGYAPPLDPAHAGVPFALSEGVRRRLPAGSSHGASEAPVDYSADVVLRPLLADSLLPSIANVLGPSELAYHAMLQPLYEFWGIQQPLPITRHGATIISLADSRTLERSGLGIHDVLRSDFLASEAIKQMSSLALRTHFSEARARVEAAVGTLSQHLHNLDPGLELRGRQTLDQMQRQLDKLEERAVRAELSRAGIPTRSLQGIRTLLVPTEKPQERVLSTFSFAARYGIEWIHGLAACGDPSRFEHRLLVLEGLHE